MRSSVFLCTLLFTIGSAQIDPGEESVVDVFYVSNTREVKISKHSDTGEIYYNQIHSTEKMTTGKRFKVTENQMDKFVERFSVKSAKIKFPGTLWCGPGTDADRFADLGEEAETDACCRTHDRCKPSIPAFRSRFGLFNFAIWAKSHCKCDRAFHECLTTAATNSSEDVGYWFFNFLNVECFEKVRPTKCITYNFLGFCIEEEPDRSQKKIWSFVDLDLSF